MSQGHASGLMPTYYLDSETGLLTINKGVNGAALCVPYTEVIGMGLVPGHSGFRGWGERTGLTVGSAGNDVWQGAATTLPVPNQTVGEQLTLVSTSAADAAAGAGARTISIHGLDAAGNPQVETVTLNGVTPVNTVRTDWRFVQSIHSETVGTGLVPTGTISVYKVATPATEYNVLLPGGNMSLNSARMIPLGKTFYLTNLSVMATDNTSVSVRLRATCTEEGTLTTGLFFLYKDVSLLLNSSREKTFRVPLVFPSLCLIKFTAYPTTNGSAVAVNYDGWIE